MFNVRRIRSKLQAAVETMAKTKLVELKQTLSSARPEPELHDPYYKHWGRGGGT